jgi:predicted GIY-YIG superfamily endonuclease
MPPKQYYNSYGQQIQNPRAYAATGAPMYNKFTTNTGKPVNNPTQYAKAGRQLYANQNINEKRSVYAVECKGGKKYIGETGDFDRRMHQHFSGNGAQVTQKYTPKRATELESVPGYFAKEVEQKYTEDYIKKYGYDRVRGGKHTNSTTL